MDDNSGNRLIGPGNDSGSGLSLQSPLVIAVVLISVLILSIGIVGCSIFFIWMCFLHPDAAKTFLPILIPAGIAGVTAHLGTKAVKLLVEKKEKEESK